MTRKLAHHRVPRNYIMPKKTQTPIANPAEEDIDRAVERVYRVYGPDLSVFFGAIQDHLQRSERRAKDDQSDAVHAGV